MRVLLDVAAEHEAILDDPSPSVRVEDPDDTAIVLQARFWIADSDREGFSVSRSEYMEAVTAQCEWIRIELTTTTQHQLSGEPSIRDSA